MNRFAFLFFAAFFSTGLLAESPCPAGIRPVPFHNSTNHQMVIQVSVNHAGPFDFLLDTGTQMTVLDRSLAAELQIPAIGPADVVGVSFRGKASFAKVAALEVGDHGFTDRRVLLYDMDGVQRAGFMIRGLLGQDFLSGFDVLIDNSHGVLCIDDTGAMRAGLNNSSSR